MGIQLDVRSLKKISPDKESISYNTSETQKYIIFQVSSSYKGKRVEFFAEGKFLFSAIVGHKSEIQVQKKSQIGKNLLEQLNFDKNIEIKL